MLIGAIVLAALVLLLLLAERGSGMMWRDGRPAALYYCPPCDLRYPRHELTDVRQGVCPRGHHVQPVAGDYPVGVVLIWCCVGFIVLGLALIATGVIPVP